VRFVLRECMCVSMQASMVQKLQEQVARLEADLDSTSTALFTSQAELTGTQEELRALAVEGAIVSKDAAASKEAEAALRRQVEELGESAAAKDAELKEATAAKEAAAAELEVREYAGPNISSRHGRGSRIVENCKGTNKGWLRSVCMRGGPGRFVRSGCARRPRRM
jgi:hypothetical protein